MPSEVTDLQRSIIRMDDPRHARLRALIQRRSNATHAIKRMPCAWSRGRYWSPTS